MTAISNEELVQKAVITTDAIAAQGKLNDAQSDRFIDFVIQETVLKDAARVVRFRNENLDIDKIGVGTRVAMPKAEAKDPGLRRGINTSKVTLTPREIIVPFEIGDVFKEVNLEGEDVEDHVVQMMARQLANDLEELYVGGDVLGPAVPEGDIIEGGSADPIKDSYLALFDGWERLADGGNIFDAQGQSIGLSVFGGMMRAMPTKFRRNKNDLRWYMSPDLAQLYHEKLSTRATNLGDQAAGGGTQTPFGVPIVEVPLQKFLPTVVQHLTFTGDNTSVTLRYAPVANVVVSTDDLGGVPTVAFILDTDYAVNNATGVVTHDSGGAIGNTDTVKITYNANPQILLTHRMNWIVGIGRDIRIEKDRDIFKGVNQYAITAKVSVEFEEDTAIVKGQNIGTSL